MKYDLTLFEEAVTYYKEKFASFSKKTCFVTFPLGDKKAFYSLAPLSRALHELECEVSAIGYGVDRESIDVVREVWGMFERLRKGEKGEKEDALLTFIGECNGKFPEIEDIFKRPEIELKAVDGTFEGTVRVEYKDGWMKEHRMEELKETSRILWKEVYNIKEGERVGIGFELIDREEKLGHPLEDYLDSYQIIWTMASECPGKPSLSASTSKESMLVVGERASDLRAMLLGCELDKEVDEQPFIAFKKLSEVMNLSRLKPVDASFAVHGKGYPGKHRFGEAFGYPSLNKKTRWKTPGQLIYKLDFYPQTKFEDRDPMARVAFTETLPIDVFIETNLVDWADIRNRNQKVKDVLDKCDVVFVKGKLNEEHVTNLEVGLVKPDGTRRWVRRSDTDVREKLNKEYLERTGIRAGCMGNIPGGEAFVTPEYMKGTFVGDVVIAIDQSYPLKKEEPFVVECSGDEYVVKSAPKEILDKFNEKKSEAWKMLEEAEKNKSLPQEIIDLKKKNFNRIGEFAINTNPKAQLCDYLIVNEKIAKMMHIAMGSGYEEDRSTDYHVDVVFDAPRQKLDVYGTDKEGREHWILKDGEFIT